LKANEHPGAWLLEALAKGGVDTQELSRRLPEQMDLAIRSPHTLRPDAVNAILLECASLSGDGDFGLRMIDLVDLSRLGIYGYLLMNAPTVVEALEIACRYYPTFYMCAALDLSTADGVASLSYRVKVPATVSERHDNEWTLGFFVSLIRRGAADDWTPTRATFTHSSPENLAELTRTFGPNLYFDHSINSIEFPVDVLNYCINETDSHLLRVLTQHADNLLTGIQFDANLAGKVRLLILENLGSGTTNAAKIAKALNISLSTLKRRLLQDGCSYRELRDGVVEEVAKIALRESDVPVSEVAVRVGYSELSAFDRAFARITGMTPMEYRAQASREVPSK